MKTVVLDGFAINPGDLSWDFLGKYGEYKVLDKTPDSGTAAAAQGADAVFTNRAMITAQFLAACPAVKFVGALGTGCDMIDVAACRSAGVEVCNVPAYSTASVAQLTVTMLLSLAADMDALCGIAPHGYWTGVPGFFYQNINYFELAGKTLGLLGCGDIGSRVAAIASALGMRVIASTKTHTSGQGGCVSYVPLDTLLGESDFLSLHLPLCDGTRGMVNSAFISKMKDGAYLINTARGAILCENDVAEALNSGKLAGAFLDVLAKEPADPHNPLLSARGCRITPHCAWATREARGRLLCEIEKNLSSFISTGKALHRVF